MARRSSWLLIVAAAFMVVFGSHEDGFPRLAAPEAAAQSTASVEGFRTARFGMTEAGVYKALKKDFGFAKKEVTNTQNAIEKTTSLVIAVDNIIPDSGQAIVAYIFGFESKKLIQINVIWSSAEKSLAAAENLVATGNILRNYFVGQGFPDQGMLKNQRLTNGSIVMFRGIDGKGRAAVLQLNIEPGAVAEDGSTGDGQITSLSLSYILDPESPDVFKVKQGDF